LAEFKYLKGLNSLRFFAAFFVIILCVLRTNVARFGYGISTKILIPLYYLVLLAGTIGVAAVSYKYFESYFLKIKKKMSVVKNEYSAKVLSVD